MTLEELEAGITEDAKIDATRLDSESLNIPTLHAKWMIILVHEERELKGLKIRLATLNKELYELYAGKAPDEEYKKRNFHLKVLDKHAPLYIESDEAMIKLKSKIEMQGLKVDLVKEFIKQLNQRGFAIKNAIDYQKFKNGGY